MVGAEKSKLFMEPGLADRFTVSGCDRSPVRLNAKLIRPPSVPTASAILTAGTDPASSSIIVPVAEDAAPMV